MKKQILLVAVLAAAGLAFCAAPGAAQGVPALQASPTPNPYRLPEPVITPPPALPPIVHYDRFVEGGYIAPPLVCNQFSPCNPGNRYGSRAARAAVEFPLINTAVTGMVKVDYRTYGYAHPAGLITMPGGAGSAQLYTGAFGIRDTDVSYRAGVQLTGPKVYLAGAYLEQRSTSGYPNLRGYGLGIEKLPDLNQILSLYLSYYYYPTVKADYYLPGAPNTTYRLSYHVSQYDFGVALKPSTHSPIFVDLGYLGDKNKRGENAPANITRNGPFVGLGVNF